jgi:flagellin-like protein
MINSVKNKRGKNRMEENNKFSPYNFSSKNRKALSGVVTTVIMIALIMAAGVLIWSFVKNMIEDETSQAESCFGIFNKVSINNDYTCHNSLEDEMWVSINMGDIDVEELLISIAGANSKIFRISNSNQDLNDFLNYPNKNIGVTLPQKNGGKTYVVTGIATKPDGIYIAPKIKGKQCEASDSLEEIDDCQALF